LIAFSKPFDIDSFSEYVWKLHRSHLQGFEMRALLIASRTPQQPERRPRGQTARSARLSASVPPDSTTISSGEHAAPWRNMRRAIWRRSRMFPHASS
jgi:hypothetical protein